MRRQGANLGHGPPVLPAREPPEPRRGMECAHQCVHPGHAVDPRHRPAQHPHGRIAVPGGQRGHRREDGAAARHRLSARRFMAGRTAAAQPHAARCALSARGPARRTCPRSRPCRASTRNSCGRPRRPAARRRSPSRSRRWWTGRCRSSPPRTRIPAAAPRRSPVHGGIVAPEVVFRPLALLGLGERGIEVVVEIAAGRRGHGKVQPMRRL